MEQAATNGDGVVVSMFGSEAETGRRPDRSLVVAPANDRATLTFAEQVVSEVGALVVILDRDGRVARFNRKCEELSGLLEVSLAGTRGHLSLFCADEESAASRIENAFASGRGFDIEHGVSTIQGVRQIVWTCKLIQAASSGEDCYLVCSGVDVTEERRAQRRLTMLATRDVLTGLPNRQAIQDHILSAIENPATGPFCVLFVDLDNFKNINDNYGHLTGDLLLQKVGQAISDCLRPSDRLARLGGDEFLVVVDESAGTCAEMLAAKIVQCLRQPFQLGLVQAYSGCSIGMARFPDHGVTREDLIRNADTALYAAKGAGRQTYRMFTPAMNARVREALWLDTNLRRALESGEFELRYQPKIDLKSGEVHSVEALIRWNSLERGEIEPNQFIGYAEESGLIVPMAKWVMRTAAAQAAKWKLAGHDLRVAVNLSARNFLSDSVVDDFVNSLRDADLVPCLLDIELTESCLLADEHAARDMITRFRELGAEVHLDDFGTGYSSLSQLTRLPLDVIKLDRSFISPGDKNARAIVRAVVTVAHELDCRIVAEGVETLEQAEFLRNLGVDNAQGFLFGKPMTAEDFDAWHTSRRLVPKAA